jgi:hypothetical protein
VTQGPRLWPLNLHSFGQGRNKTQKYQMMIASLIQQKYPSHANLKRRKGFL